VKIELFKDIKIIEKKGGIKPIHTIGWKFEYKKNQYGNFISDQIPTGKYVKYWDEEENCECERPVMKKVPITLEDQIGLMKNMIAVMEALSKGKLKKK